MIFYFSVQIFTFLVKVGSYFPLRAHATGGGLGRGRMQPVASTGFCRGPGAAGPGSQKSMFSKKILEKLSKFYKKDDFLKITLKFKICNFYGTILQIQLISDECHCLFEKFLSQFWQILIIIAKIVQRIMKINNYADIKFILIENFQCRK